MKKTLVNPLKIYKISSVIIDYMINSKLETIKVDYRIKNIYYRKKNLIFYLKRQYN